VTVISRGLRSLRMRDPNSCGVSLYVTLKDEFCSNNNLAAESLKESIQGVMPVSPAEFSREINNQAFSYDACLTDVR
jgi:hypothetical protein